MKRPRIEEIRKDAIFTTDGNPAGWLRVAYLCDYALHLEKLLNAKPDTTKLPQSSAENVL